MKIYSFDKTIKDEFLECQKNIFIVENLKDINTAMNKSNESIIPERKGISDLIINLVL